MQLEKLRLKDEALFVKFLSLKKHALSVYAFQNIYIWKDLFDIRWAVIEGNLCVFFKDRIGCFLYIGPQGARLKPEVIQEVFSTMDSYNENPGVSRIENVEAKDIPFYRGLGYVHYQKPGDYLCLRTDLAALRGGRFKSKRADRNYFIKHYQFKFLSFSSADKDSCLKLYGRWMKGRRAQSDDLICRGMLLDSRRCLKILLKDYKKLNFIGRIVKIGNKIKAFSFGFRLNRDTFCILYEITDLSVKGLAQFIFCEFCRQLKGYKYINIMDDSGLENLKQVKLSYHPLAIIPSYVVQRGHP